MGVSVKELKPRVSGVSPFQEVCWEPPSHCRVRRAHCGVRRLSSDLLMNLEPEEHREESSHT